MKKSEFLNKTKEELEQILEELQGIDAEYGDDDDEIKLIKLLLTNDGVLKNAVKDKDGREQLLVLAETVKGVLGVFKMAEENETLLAETDLILAAMEGSVKGKARAEELEKDFEDDMPETISEREVLSSVLDTVSENFDVDRDELEDVVNEEIAREYVERKFIEEFFGIDEDEDNNDLN